MTKLSMHVLLLFSMHTAVFSQLVSNNGEYKHQAFTIPLGDIDGVPQGLTGQVTVRPCPMGLADNPTKVNGSCLEYNLQRYGTIGLFHTPHEVKLRFDIGGLCLNKPTQWSEITKDEFGFSTSNGFRLEDAQECTVELVEVSLASDGLPEIDFTDQLKSVQAKRDVEGAARKTASGRSEKSQERAGDKGRRRASEDPRVLRRYLSGHD